MTEPNVREAGLPSGLLQAAAKIKQHFQGDVDSYSAKWDILWNQNLTPWDQGRSHPALEETLLSQQALLQGSTKRDSDGSVRSKRALVPGCGSGYDVFKLAGFGYDVWGLEISPRAVEVCEQLSQKDRNEEHAAKNSEHGIGNIVFATGNFFDRDWQERIGGSFDLIYDYTFFCALHPELRTHWAQRMVELLTPGGHLICLEFPFWKPFKDGGPPWGVSEHAYSFHLRHPGASVAYTAEGLPQLSLDSSQTASELRRVHHEQTKSNHTYSQNSDCISIWARN